MENEVDLVIDSRLENLSIVRVCVSSFLVQTNITIDELSDIKTAVSEAVTNSIEHGYFESFGKIYITLKLVNLDGMMYFGVDVKDEGVGIDNIELCCTPSYTSKPDLEHAGMGFSIMETFMDEVVIDSVVNEKTIISMRKKLKTVRSK